MRLKHRNKTSSLGALHKSVLKNLNRILIFSVFYFNDKYFSQALYFRCHLLTWQGVVCGHFSSPQKKSTGWHQRWAKLFRKVHIFSSHWPLLTCSHQKYRQAPEHITGQISIWSLGSFPKAWVPTVIMPLCQSQWFKNQCKAFSWIILSNKLHFSF